MQNNNMQVSNHRRIAKNTIFLYLRMFVMMLLSLYTTRVVIHTLGIDDYGLYNVVGGIVVFFSFITSGLTGATKRYIIAELASGDIKSQKLIYSIALRAHIILVLFVLLAGETIGLWLFYNTLNIPEGREVAAMVVYQFSLVIASIGILKALYNSLIISFEKMSVYAYFSILDVILILLMVISLQVIRGDKLIYYAFFNSILALFSLFLYYFYSRRQFEMCRYVKDNDRNIFLSLLKYIWWTLFASGANVLSRQGVNMLLNNFFSVAMNAAMGISNMIVNAANQFVQNVQIAFQPQISKNYISKSYDELGWLTIQSSRYTSYLVLLILIPLFFVITNVLNIWLSEYPKYTEEFCLLILFCVLIESISLPLTTAITSDKNISKYQMTVSVCYLMIFIFSWIVLWLASLPYYVIFVRLLVDVALIIIKLLFIKQAVQSYPWITWCKEVLLKPFVIVCLSTPMFFIKYALRGLNDWQNLFVIVPISILWFGILVWFIALNEGEKTLILSRIKRKSHES